MIKTTLHGVLSRKTKSHRMKGLLFLLSSNRGSCSYDSAIFMSILTISIQTNIKLYSEGYLDNSLQYQLILNFKNISARTHLQSIQLTGIYVKCIPKKNYLEIYHHVYTVAGLTNLMNLTTFMGQYTLKGKIYQYLTRFLLPL